MFAQAMTFLTSVIISGSMLFGSLALPTKITTSSQQQPPVQATDKAPGQKFDLLQARSPRFWPFKGDRLVRAGLIRATADVTGLEPKEVLASLKDKMSLADIAVAQGKSADQVLAAFDKKVEEGAQKAVDEEKLSADMAKSRVEWFKDVARKMVVLPAMRPIYPGLHELHVAMITAAVRVSGMERAVVRSELEKCRTINEILADEGKTGQEAVDAAMKIINRGLDALVKLDRLTQEQRDEWSADISAALTKMIDTPGLHVAGKACAP